jgi:hypothetical protein
LSTMVKRPAGVMVPGAMIQEKTGRPDNEDTQLR